MTRKITTTALPIVMLFTFGLTGCATTGSDKHPLAAESDTATHSILALTASSPPVTTGNGVSVSRARTAQNSSVDVSTGVIISAVIVNRTFDLQPFEPALSTHQTGQRYDSEAPLLRVTGTYYPKGVYEEPAAYSRLIERAAPGELFQLDNEVNEWYKVVTDQGIGYIHRSDGTLVR